MHQINVNNVKVVLQYLWGCIKWSIFVINISTGQVREAIGVTLSVLCSNFRLYASSSEELSSGVGKSDVYGHNWADYLSKQASERVVRIQSSAQSDLMEDSSEVGHPNGPMTGGTKDDIKWMETVPFS